MASKIWVIWVSHKKVSTFEMCTFFDFQLNKKEKTKLHVSRITSNRKIGIFFLHIILSAGTFEKN